MYKRIFDIKKTLERKSLIILGPRQTGKSTWLKNNFPDAYYLDLLRPQLYQELSTHPERLEEIISFEKKKHKLFIIDEIQSIPILMNEIHRQIEEDKSLRFILTGSSARKLKRTGNNLLGGRLARYFFHPLVFPEYTSSEDAVPFEKVISKGSLPSILKSDDAYEDLSDYVGLYLKEEIQAEGLSRSIENFSKFLHVSALCQAEQINFTQIGNDAGVPPRTIIDYFNILEDTLTGYLLPAFTKTITRKAMTSAKFYFFDIGIGNSLMKRKEIAPETPEFGKNLEQLIFLELTAYKDYRCKDLEISYWRSTSKFEVDFVLELGKNMWGIEVKSKKNPSTNDYKGLNALSEDFPKLQKICLCLCSTARTTKEGITLIPIKTFLKMLWNNEIFGN